MVGPAAKAPGMPTGMAVSGTVTGTLGAAVETTVLGTAVTATFDTTVETTALGAASCTRRAF